MLGFLFGLNGRISRKGIWLGYLLPYLAISIVVGIVLPILSGVVELFYVWPALIAVPVKRFHDRNMTGWWTLIFFVLSMISAIVAITAAAPLIDAEALAEAAAQPAPDPQVLMELLSPALGSTMVAAGFAALATIGIVQFVILFVLPGTKGENQYGADPRDG